MSRPTRTTIAIFVLLLFAITAIGTSVVAQTPSAAISHFKAGVKENEKGNFDLAIEELTIAIEISSHPMQRATGKRVLSNPLARSAESRPTDEPKTVTLLDPFTAVAYVNRCFARYRKGDFAGAIADCDQAIHINPRLAVAYLNRGAARRAIDGEAAALLDLNRAIEIDASMADAFVARGDLRKHLGDIDGGLSEQQK